MTRTRIMQLAVLAAAAACAVFAGFVTTSGRADAADELENARSSVDVAREEQDALREEAERLSKLIGLPIDLDRQSATLEQVDDFADRDYFEESRAIPFGMVGLSHGVAFRIVSVERVEEGRRTWEESEERKRLPPIKPTRDDIHLVKIELDVINRSGGGDDPACGMVGELEQARVLMVDNTAAVRGVEAAFSDTTYSGACMRSIPDGGRGRVTVYWGVQGEDERIVALDPGFSGRPETNPIARAHEDDPVTTGERPDELLLLFPKPV